MFGFLAAWTGGRLTAPLRDAVLGVRTRPLFTTRGTILAFLLLNFEIAGFYSVSGQRVLTFQFSGNFARDMSYTIAWASSALGLLSVALFICFFTIGSGSTSSTGWGHCSPSRRSPLSRRLFIKVFVPPMRKMRSNVIGLLLLLVAGALASLRALEPTEWKFRQSLVVERAGVLKINLPPETLGVARPGLEDLRVIDPAGNEVPYLISPPTPFVPPKTQTVAAFHLVHRGGLTTITIETGTTEPIETIYFDSPQARFWIGVTAEASKDGEHWPEPARPGVIFCRNKAEPPTLAFNRQSAAFVRIFIGDGAVPLPPLTGARVQLVGAVSPEHVEPTKVRLVRREEFFQVSMLTLDLGAANLPLTDLECVTTAPYFHARPVFLEAREFSRGALVERPIASGAIWSRPDMGARLDLRVGAVAPAREVLMYIYNAGQPPLEIADVMMQMPSAWLGFQATERGTYTLLTGNSSIAAPQYEVASLLAAVHAMPASEWVPGAPVANPDYRTPDAPVNLPMSGTALDLTHWRFHKSIGITTTGLQQLELDLDVITGAQSNFADLRLVAEGVPLPYLVERPEVGRTYTLALSRNGDPKRPSVSRWQLKRSRAALPVEGLTFTSPTRQFQRHFSFYELVPGSRAGEVSTHSLGEADWSHAADDGRPLTLNLSVVPVSDTFFLETDDGADSPISITAAQVTHQVARLLFKADFVSPGPTASSKTGPVVSRRLELYYGNPVAEAPHDDLAWVAGQILADSTNIATLGTEERTRASGWLMGALRRTTFWIALAFGLAGLIVVVVKFLPRPTSAR